MSNPFDQFDTFSAPTPAAPARRGGGIDVDAIARGARDLGIDPVDLATAISYETGGTFDPDQWGPTTKWGRHRGLIQFGEPQRAQYGVRPEEAIDGLRASIFNTVLNKSRNARDGVLNIDQVKNYLFTPTSVGKKPLVQVMQEQGVLKPADVTNIRRLFDAATNIQRAQKPGTALEVKGNIVDVATATLSRMIGSGAAGAAARSVGSSSL